MTSKQRNMEAGGDQVDYFGKEEGKAVLTGNAWAIQDNNTMRGNRMTVFMADDGKLKATPDSQPQAVGLDKVFDGEQIIISPEETPVEATSNEH